MNVLDRRLAAPLRRLAEIALAGLVVAGALLTLGVRTVADRSNGEA